MLQRASVVLKKLQFERTKYMDQEPTTPGLTQVSHQSQQQLDTVNLMSKYDEKPKRKGGRFKVKALTKGREYK